MPVYKGNQRLKKPFTGSQRIKQAYVGNVRVFTSSNMVYYHVDTGNIKQEEVDYGASTLSPKTFTPVKTGYSFVGWSGSATSHNVLSSNIMGDNPVHLYAVFRQNITVTYYNGNATASTVSDYRRYNNGTVINPSFTLTQKALSGWTARGWSAGTSGNSGIAYSNGATFTRDSNITLYGMYQQTIYLYTLVSGSQNTYSGTRYYNSNGNAVNPTFTVPNPYQSEGTFKGWSTSSGSATISYSTINGLSLSSNLTVYAVFKYADISLEITGEIGTSERYYGSEYYRGIINFPVGMPATPEKLPESSPYYSDPNYVYTFQSGFDASKYSALTVTFTGYNHPTARSNEQWIIIRLDNVNYNLSYAWNGAGGDENPDDFDREATWKTRTYPINSKSGTVSLQCLWITNYTNESTFYCGVPKGTYFKLTGRTAVG